MPLKRDPQKGGTNADGTKSERYCSFCYQGGAFTQPDLTVGDMQQIVKEKMKSMGYPGFLASWFTKGLPKLERWR